MIVTIFRNRLRPEHAEQYATTAAAMGAEAEKMPGYVSRKVFTAEDGERVTIVEFESMETHKAWAEHTGHRAAQKLGRERFYAEYTIQVCEVLRAGEFSHKE